ncbi:heme/hemin ABC transporter substrate-binding protein [Actinomyces sp. zg-332]|uniref:heme/hemin ABC transporter substrate-binding protein n=1 Tax=Actinomyces sp. zg-332 TaxID=2708340 RepID=UPI001E42E5B4|nr:ABC transporter substrate-binding protein [Actinomyces sp. zg-332]
MKKIVVCLISLSFISGITACSQAQTPESNTKSTQNTNIDPHKIQGVTQVQDISDPKLIGKVNPKQQLPVTVTDSSGNKVTVKDTSRILALDIYGTISRTLISLGFEKNLVGRTVSDTEKSLENLPVVTQDGHALNGEAIASLKPTLIITDDSVGPPEVLESLKATGTTIVKIDSKRSIERVGKQIQQVAEIMGVTELGKKLAERTESEIKKAKEEIKTLVGDNKEPLKVAFLYVRGNGGIFFILGKGEGSDELIENVYAHDTASRAGIEGISPATAESIASINPDVFFVMSKGLESANGVEGLLERPGVAQTTAGKNKRVVAIPDGLALSFGPQTGEVLSKVAKALYLGEGK